MSVRVSKKLNEMGKRWIHTRGARAEDEEMLEMCAQGYNYSGVICSSNCRSDVGEEEVVEEEEAAAR